MPALRRNSALIRRAQKLFAITILFAATSATITALPAHAQSTSASYNGVKFLPEVPLLDCKGTPCIEARINDGASLKFVIDTGNVDSVLDTKIMKAADLQPLHPPKPGGAPIELIPTRIPVLHIGSMALTQVIAAGMDLTDMKFGNS